MVRIASHQPGQRTPKRLVAPSETSRHRASPGARRADADPTPRYARAVAKLRSVRDGQVVAVSARLRIGRAPDSGLTLEHRCVSLEHATVRWADGGWEVRDLGSRNGTFVDGKVLVAGEAAPIDIGTRLAFGDVEEAWEVVEADPPSVYAEREDGASAMGRDGLLVLPNEDRPELSIYQDNNGAWLVENNDGEATPLGDDGVVEADGARWTVRLPEIFEGTPAFQTSPTLDSISMRFAVSQDEERVQVDVVHRGRVTPLEPAWHGYVLLTLARLRERDAELPVDQRGWVARDELSSMLRMDSNALNVAIHKAREQLLSAGVLGGAGVVEVRRGGRRFGIDRFEISRM